MKLKYLLGAAAIVSSSLVNSVWARGAIENERNANNLKRYALRYFDLAQAQQAGGGGAGQQAQQQLQQLQQQQVQDQQQLQQAQQQLQQLQQAHQNEIAAIENHLGGRHDLLPQNIIHRLQGDIGDLLYPENLDRYIHTIKQKHINQLIYQVNTQLAGDDYLFAITAGGGCVNAISQAAKAAVEEGENKFQQSNYVAEYENLKQAFRDEVGELEQKVEQLGQEAVRLEQQLQELDGNQRDQNQFDQARQQFIQKRDELEIKRHELGMKQEALRLIPEDPLAYDRLANLQVADNDVLFGVNDFGLPEGQRREDIDGFVIPNGNTRQDFINALTRVVAPYEPTEHGLAPYAGPLNTEDLNAYKVHVNTLFRTRLENWFNWLFPLGYVPYVGAIEDYDVGNAANLLFDAVEEVNVSDRPEHHQERGGAAAAAEGEEAGGEEEEEEEGGA